MKQTYLAKLSNRPSQSAHEEGEYELHTTKAPKHGKKKENEKEKRQTMNITFVASLQSLVRCSMKSVPDFFFPFDSTFMHCLD